MSGRPWPLRSLGVLALAAAAALAQTTAPPAVPPEKAAKPLASIGLVNAGFESTRSGQLGAPEGWWAVQHAGPESYRFTVDTTVKRSGERSLRIENIGPEPFGTIYQAIDAVPHRGRTVRFAAWIRTDGAAGNRFGAGAGLHLQALRQGFPRATAPMRKNAVAGTSDWTRYELTLVVTSDADRIEIGLNLFGPGVAWIDDVSLDIVEAAAAPRPSVVPPAPAGKP